MGTLKGHTRFRRWRKANRKRLREVSEAIGFSEGGISRFERGLAALPLASIAPASKLSGIPIGDLMSPAQRRVYVSLAVPALERVASGAE